MTVPPEATVGVLFVARAQARAQGMPAPEPAAGPLAWGGWGCNTAETRVVSQFEYLKNETGLSETPDNQNDAGQKHTAPEQKHHDSSRRRWDVAFTRLH